MIVGLCTTEYAELVYLSKNTTDILKFKLDDPNKELINDFPGTCDSENFVPHRSWL